MGKSFASISVINARLGVHPQKNITQNGQELSSFNVAFDGGYGKDVRTVWMACTAYGSIARICNNCLYKGASVSFVGLVSQQEWQDKDGTIRNKLHCKIDNIIFNDNHERIPRQDKLPRTDSYGIDSDDYRSISDYEERHQPDNDGGDEGKWKASGEKPRKEPPPFIMNDIE